MSAYARIAVWFAAAFAGLLVWNLAPDLRPLITWFMIGMFICYGISLIVGQTVKRIISIEQLSLHNRLDVLDRKVTALLRNALEERRR